jgi:SAM-dependent methyltransferase
VGSWAYLPGRIGELYRLIKLAGGVLSRDGLSSLSDRIIHWYRYRVTQRQIDAEYGTDTVSKVPTKDLAALGPNRAHANEYDPSPAFYFNIILSHLPIHPDVYVFVDLGCGKGLTLMLAARIGFKRIIGVEFASNVYQTALANLKKFQQRAGQIKQIEIILGDAAEFEFPIEPLVIYLFNPFGPEVVVKVLANLSRSLSMHPRSCWIVYVNPRHHEYFESCELLITHSALIHGESRVPFALYTYQPAAQDVVSAKSASAT